ncbi:MAG: 16S rRNA (cytosine(1402)-N(4))-methyltransferase RsmH [Candidatus Omnitrophica bacterium]|nr:16S rRNA (cytosine(1402)-N(4))-methyltransferase RsmH [Candidatus Omnitrophota bacterium]
MGICERTDQGEHFHIPVMPQEALELLHLPQGGVAVDGTLGLAGHALLMARALGADGHLIGIDRDNASLGQAEKKLSSLGLKVDLLQGNFSTLDKILAGLKVCAVDGILLDLGISSFQLDDAKRGFSFKSDGPLDMRMDAQAQEVLAAELVNTLKENQLEKIISEFGEERFARRIAAAIVMQRAKAKITTTKILADIILRALPRGYTRGRIHPATRTFQALRIAVNEELESLSLGLEVCFKMLKKGGRLCVISFHSLEDRLVKNKFKSLNLSLEGTILTKRPLVASDEECAGNPRSRSAKMRAIERIG